MNADAFHFDTSDYPADHSLYATANKIIGKMQDETAGVALSEFVGLRMYVDIFSRALRYMFAKETFSARFAILSINL